MFPFVVEQTELPRRAIVLQGESLPFKGVEWGGTQRAGFHYFPGNPVATVQVIGSTYKPTIITGRWQDIKLFDRRNSPKLLNFPALAPAATAAGAALGGQTFLSTGSIPEQRADRARAVRDAFTLLRREGVLLRVEWGSLVRFGLITDDTFPHDREEDIDYEVQFTWSGDTNSQPRPRLLPLNPIGLLQALQALLDAILNALLTALFAAQQWVKRITQLITKLGSFVTTLLQVLEGIVGLVYTPQDVLGTLRMNLAAIRSAARDLMDEIDNAPSAVVEASLSASPAAVLLNAILSGELRRQAQEIAAEAARSLLRLAEASARRLKAVYIAPSGVSLREVSRRFYGTAVNWRLLADFNGLATSLIPRGTIVRVPEV